MILNDLTSDRIFMKGSTKFEIHVQVVLLTNVFKVAV